MAERKTPNKTELVQRISNVAKQARRSDHRPVRKASDERVERPEAYAFLLPEMIVYQETSSPAAPPGQGRKTASQKSALKQPAEDRCLCVKVRVCSCEAVSACSCHSVGYCACDKVPTCTCDKVRVCTCDSVCSCDAECSCVVECGCDAHTPAPPPGGGNSCAFSVMICSCDPVCSCDKI